MRWWLLRPKWSLSGHESLAAYARAADVRTQPDRKLDMATAPSDLRRPCRTAEPCLACHLHSLHLDNSISATSIPPQPTAVDALTMSATLPFRDINVHASSTYYAFSSPSSPNSPTLVVDRPSGDLRLNDGKITGGYRVSSVSGILGIIKLRLGRSHLSPFGEIC